mgnify:CR=1 FL=1
MKPTRQEAEESVRTILRFIGEDTEREGLIDTPSRVVKAFLEMTEGIGKDANEVLSTSFTESCDEMVVVRGIRFVSLCEHHLLPFIGQATVGYLPNKKVVGLSKIPRLVECLARRPQLQERLTVQIANTLLHGIDALGVGVVIKAHHSCMGCRGVRQPDAEMVTSAMVGAFTNPHVKQELLQLASN